MLQAAKNRQVILNIVLILILIILILVCLCAGKYSVSVLDCLKILTGNSMAADPMDANIILGVRLPRVLAAVVTGGALALSGAAYQGIFKNPLVSPEFLGVSSGACVGAAVAILFAFSAAAIQISAFAGGIVAVGLTVTIP